MEESTLCPRPKRKFWETTLTIDRANTRAIATAITLKNAYSNASFSSVTAATESLGLSDNGFKTAAKHFEVGVPQNVMRVLCAVIRPNHFKFASYGPVSDVAPLTTTF